MNHEGAIRFATEIGAQESRRVQLNLSLEEFRKLVLHGEERQPRHMPWLELHQHIYVAIWPEVIAQHRAEQRQLADGMTFAEVSDGFLRHVDLWLGGRGPA